METDQERCDHQRIDNCPVTVVGTCKHCGRRYCRYHAKEHGSAHTPPPVQEQWQVDKGRNVGWTVSKHTEDAYTEFLIHFEAEAHALATLLNALEARAEADRQRAEKELQVQRDLRDTTWAWGDVWKARARAAEARVAELEAEVTHQEAKAFLEFTGRRAAEAERDALRARAELAVSALQELADHPGARFPSAYCKAQLAQIAALTPAATPPTEGA